VGFDVSGAPKAAEELCARIRCATSSAEVDDAVTQMYRALAAGELSDAETLHVTRVAERRRTAFKKPAARAIRALVNLPAPPGSEAGPQTQIHSGSTESVHDVPPWIGGECKRLSFKQSKAQFYLRRNVWLRQVFKARVSRLTLRVAHAVFDGLNADPRDRRFGQCFKSLSTLSVELECRRASIVAALKSLESAGVLRIIQGGGRGNPNRYEPVIADFASRDLQSPVVP
jgi:hypothetical protein